LALATHAKQRRTCFLIFFLARVARRAVPVPHSLCALLSSYLPGRRATGVDPASTLRVE
jgi:hypothetical protein